MSDLADDGTVGVFDLKTHLSAGRPTLGQRRRAIQEIREIAKAAKPLPAGVTIESLYKEGRL